MQLSLVKFLIIINLKLGPNHVSFQDIILHKVFLYILILFLSECISHHVIFYESIFSYHELDLSHLGVTTPSYWTPMTTLSSSSNNVTPETSLQVDLPSTAYSIKSPSLTETNMDSPSMFHHPFLYLSYQKLTSPHSLSPPYQLTHLMINWAKNIIFKPIKEFTLVATKYPIPTLQSRHMYLKHYRIITRKL